MTGVRREGAGRAWVVVEGRSDALPGRKAEARGQKRLGVHMGG